ncbi:MAG: MaoC/PaaZ C-terminal domain-containing protein [Planctomycetota bacterium]
MSTDGLHFEDLSIGQRFRTASIEVTADAISEYAARYDPQPMHLDGVAAEAGFFGRLVASGWHTLSLTMGLMVRAKPFGAAPLVGVRVDAIRFRRPVLPGMVLHAEAEIIELTPPRPSRPDRGLVGMRVATLAAGETEVLAQDWTVLAFARPASPS